MILSISRDCEIRAEHGKRAATCGICDKSIPKGTRRILVSYKLSEWKTRPNGSKFIMAGKRYHPSCLSGLILGDNNGDIQQNLSCLDCANPVEGRILNFVSTGRWSNSPLCSRCATSPRWKFCTGCSMFAPIHKASPIIEDGVITLRWLCDRCSEHSDLLTVKIRKRLRRSHES